MTAGRAGNALSRHLPIAGWLPRYDRAWLRGDVAAGIAVTALIVPKNLGYAEIAGLPVQNGLYAAAAGAILYALFCTSRQISTGPAHRWRRWRRRGAADRAEGRARRGVGGGDHLATGVLFLLSRCCGWVDRPFLSKPVITGFLAGAAIDVVIGELPS